jgi:hypothetical protein
MGYLGNLLRQSGVQVGPRPAVAGSPTAQVAALHTDVTRVVTPSRAPDDVPPAPGEQPGAPPAIAAVPAAVRDRSAPPLSESRQASHDEVAAMSPESVRAIDAERGEEIVVAPPVPDRAAELPREAPPAPPQIVLERVAEVVAWVAAGSEPVEEPTPPSEQADSPAPAPHAARPAQAAPSPTAAAHREPRADAYDLTVSVGTIELTVEEPPGPAVAATQAPPARPAPPTLQGRAPALTRHYVRV